MDSYAVLKYPLTTESAMKKIEDNNTLVSAAEGRRWSWEGVEWRRGNELRLEGAGIQGQVKQRRRGKMMEEITRCWREIGAHTYTRTHTHTHTHTSLSHLTKSISLSPLPRSPPQVFIVDLKATKKQIKAAVASLYDIQTKKINTLIR
jgi:ribosomal protein L23